MSKMLNVKILKYLKYLKYFNVQHFTHMDVTFYTIDV
jgi:hypothetical protein